MSSSHRPSAHRSPSDRDPFTGGEFAALAPGRYGNAITTSPRAKSANVTTDYPRSNDQGTSMNTADFWKPLVTRTRELNTDTKCAQPIVSLSHSPKHMLDDNDRPLSSSEELDRGPPAGSSTEWGHSNRSSWVEKGAWERPGVLNLAGFDKMPDVAPETGWESNVKADLQSRDYASKSYSLGSYPGAVISKYHDDLSARTRSHRRRMTDIKIGTASHSDTKDGPAETIPRESYSMTSGGWTSSHHRGEGHNGPLTDSTSQAQAPSLERRSSSGRHPAGQSKQGVPQSSAAGIVFQQAPMRRSSIVQRQTREARSDERQRESRAPSSAPRRENDSRSKDQPPRDPSREKTGSGGRGYGRPPPFHLVQRPNHDQGTTPSWRTVRYEREVGYGHSPRRTDSQHTRPRLNRDDSLPPLSKATQDNQTVPVTDGSFPDERGRRRSSSTYPTIRSKYRTGPLLIEPARSEVPARTRDDHEQDERRGRGRDGQQPAQGVVSKKPTRRRPVVDQHSNDTLEPRAPRKRDMLKNYILGGGRSESKRYWGGGSVDKESSDEAAQFNDRDDLVHHPRDSGRSARSRRSDEVRWQEDLETWKRRSLRHARRAVGTCNESIKNAIEQSCENTNSWGEKFGYTTDRASRHSREVRHTFVDKLEEEATAAIEDRYTTLRKRGAGAIPSNSVDFVGGITKPEVTTSGVKIWPTATLTICDSEPVGKVGTNYVLFEASERGGGGA